MDKMEEIKLRVERASEMQGDANINKNDIIELFKYIEEIKLKNAKLEFYNQELQSLDGLQQLTIERLNAEISRLRESIHVLEDQIRRNMAINITS